MRQVKARYIKFVFVDFYGPGAGLLGLQFNEEYHCSMLNFGSHVKYRKDEGDIVYVH